jgi:hypothetical protein
LSFHQFLTLRAWHRIPKGSGTPYPHDKKIAALNPFSPLKMQTLDLSVNTLIVAISTDSSYPTPLAEMISASPKDSVSPKQDRTMLKAVMLGQKGLPISSLHERPVPFGTTKKIHWIPPS